jgi:hypothetical protein
MHAWGDERLRLPRDAGQNGAVQRFADDLRARFPDRVHVFDGYQEQVGALEDAFREYAKIASAEERLLRTTRKLTRAVSSPSKPRTPQAVQSTSRTA